MSEKGRDIRNTIITVGTTVAALAAAHELSRFAFAPEVGNYIRFRDKGICQCGHPECERTWADGYNGQAAHYPAKHQEKTDYDHRHGRFLATPCHIFEELERKNYRGALALYNSSTFRTFAWICDTGGVVIRSPRNRDIQDLIAERQELLGTSDVVCLTRQGRITHAVAGDIRPSFNQMVNFFYNPELYPLDLNAGW